MFDNISVFKKYYSTIEEYFLGNLKFIIIPGGTLSLSRVAISTFLGFVISLFISRGQARDLVRTLDDLLLKVKQIMENKHQIYQDNNDESIVAKDSS